jgi:hypothetical protein
MARKFKVNITAKPRKKIAYSLTEDGAREAYEDAMRRVMECQRHAFEARCDGLSENQCSAADAACRYAQSSADAAYAQYCRAVKRTSTRNLR